MSHSPPGSDDRIEHFLGNVLRMGVIVAAIIVGIGGVDYLLECGRSAPHTGTFVGEPRELRSVSGILADAASGDSRGIIQLGLLVLLATPVARVVFSLAAFAWQRDLTYVLVTLIVLAVLIYSLTGGHL